MLYQTSVMTAEGTIPKEKTANFFVLIVDVNLWKNARGFKTFEVEINKPRWVNPP